MDRRNACVACHTYVSLGFSAPKKDLEKWKRIKGTSGDDELSESVIFIYLVLNILICKYWTHTRAKGGTCDYDPEHVHATIRTMSSSPTTPARTHGVETG